MHKRYYAFFGRYQPPHKGHLALILTKLKQGQYVWIGLRRTPINDENPYTVRERMFLWRKLLPVEYQDRVLITEIPDIGGVCYGRGVGYDVERIELDSETEKISGTAIRNGQAQEVSG